MNYANIKYYDIANGEGVRTSLFVSGCRRRCPNCFNAVAWDFAYGQPFTKEVRNKILESLAPDYISGLSLLGGEPLDPRNQRTVCDLVLKVRAKFPEKSIWCYTGYTLEADLLSGKTGELPIVKALLGAIDVLVDGRFVEAKKDLRLRFRGSSNQRIIGMNKTRAAGQIVLWQDDPIFADHKM